MSGQKHNALVAEIEDLETLVDVLELSALDCKRRLASAAERELALEVKVDRLRCELRAVAVELDKTGRRLMVRARTVRFPMCCERPTYDACEGCGGADACADEPCASCRGCDERGGV